MKNKIDFENLSNYLIDYLCEAFSISETIILLYNAGLSKEDLEYLNFTKEDIEKNIQ